MLLWNTIRLILHSPKSLYEERLSRHRQTKTRRAADWRYSSDSQHPQDLPFQSENADMCTTDRVAGSFQTQVAEAIALQIPFALIG